MFQSTPPARAATLIVEAVVQCNRVSIHAARAGGDERISAAPPAVDVSIHAARAGGDSRVCTGVVKLQHVSIHAARAGGDANSRVRSGSRNIRFNPRRPRGRRRSSAALIEHDVDRFNPRRPRGRRRCAGARLAIDS